MSRPMGFTEAVMCHALDVTISSDQSLTVEIHRSYSPKPLSPRGEKITGVWGYLLLHLGILVTNIEIRGGHWWAEVDSNWIRVSELLERPHSYCKQVAATA